MQQHQPVCAVYDHYGEKWRGVHYHDRGFDGHTSVPKQRGSGFTGCNQ